jgi:hypothetical protein
VQLCGEGLTALFTLLMRTHKARQCRCLRDDKIIQNRVSVFDVRVRVDLDLNDDTISFTSEGLKSPPSVMRGCGCGCGCVVVRVLDDR